MNFPVPQPTQEVCSDCSLYFPAWQDAHSAAATVSLHFPVGQLVHATAAAPEYVPVPQLTQVEMAVDAVLSLIFPASQEVHVDSAVAATVSLHFPAAQLVHAAAAAPEYVPASQSEHDSEPLEAEYFPENRC